MFGFICTDCCASGIVFFNFFEFFLKVKRIQICFLEIIRLQAENIWFPTKFDLIPFFFYLSILFLFSKVVCCFGHQISKTLTSTHKKKKAWHLVPQSGSCGVPSSIIAVVAIFFFSKMPWSTQQISFPCFISSLEQLHFL